MTSSNEPHDDDATKSRGFALERGEDSVSVRRTAFGPAGFGAWVLWGGVVLIVGFVSIAYAHPESPKAGASAILVVLVVGVIHGLVASFRGFVRAEFELMRHVIRSLRVVHPSQAESYREPELPGHLELDGEEIPFERVRGVAVESLTPKQQGHVALYVALEEQAVVVTSSTDHAAVLEAGKELHAAMGLPGEVAHIGRMPDPAVLAGLVLGFFLPLGAAGAMAFTQPMFGRTSTLFLFVCLAIWPLVSWIGYRLGKRALRKWLESFATR